MSGETSGGTNRDMRELDRTLRSALGAVRLPESIWIGFEARLAAEAGVSSAGAGPAGAGTGNVASWGEGIPPALHRNGRGAGDPVPILAAAASFCALFQLYLASGGPLFDRVAGYVFDGVILVERWAIILSTLLSGG